MYEVVDDFTRLIKDAVGESWKDKDKEAQDAHDKFLNLFGKELVKAFQKLLALPKKDFNPKQYDGMVIHVGLMLEQLGRLGQPEVADFLSRQLADSKSDVIRLFAFKGLRESFGARPPEVFRFTQDPEREAIVARLEPLLDFLTRPPALPANPSDEEVAALRYVRREAIKALAQTRLHSVPFLDGKTLKAHVAHALARVLVGDKSGMTPPASLSERLEAAIGLCQMKAEIEANRDAIVRLQPELVVGLVGKTVNELAQAYQQDFPHIDLKGGKVPRLPWKVYAERMDNALKELQANLPAKADSARKNAQDLHKAASALLKLMKSHKGLSDLAELQEVLRNMPRPAADVYSGAPGPQIQIGAWPPFEG
jgi:hypothetical protein